MHKKCNPLQYKKLQHPHSIQRLLSNPGLETIYYFCSHWFGQKDISLRKQRISVCALP